MSKNNLIIIDAGVEHIHLALYRDEAMKSILIPNNNKIETLFKNHDVLKLIREPNHELYLTGKLAETVRAVAGRGQIIIPSAALWAGANFLLQKSKNIGSLGIIDLSASGYRLVAVDRRGNLKNDLLITNPHCGAGSGINLNRILEKLAIEKKEVDNILHDYLGESGKAKRQSVSVRADRCGVFSSSATISDKNQGIPLSLALAVTMKSEVLKAVKKMQPGIETVYLTGRVFAWQFLRDSARDYLATIGVKEILYDQEQTIMIRGAKHLLEKIGRENFKNQPAKKLSQPQKLSGYPSFSALKEKYLSAGLFKRLADPEIKKINPEKFQTTPVNIGLDVGSTMAKMLITDAASDAIMFKSSCDNHGDTIETIRHIFASLKSAGVTRLNLQNLGLTGSGRYQVQKILQKVYPALASRIFVLVENYAHAHGSLACAKDHIKNLTSNGQKVNADFCALVDIGGEDTKVSIISLKKEELFDNAMNTKCSAGTGSLMDTLKSLFGIKEISQACRLAYEAPKAYEINATCAVFLMENARIMQALGYAKDEILASANYAIVENMARTLWQQVEFPKNAVVLLHGQTMLSDPLPLAVTHRLSADGTIYSLIPPLPGHRACLGLIKSIKDKTIIANNFILDNFIKLKFDKIIITCRGAACGDRNAACSRTQLSSGDAGEKLLLTLGGCTAINELATKTPISDKTPDAYKEIWQFIDSNLPKTKVPNRLVIPRSFAISEQAFFLAKIFEKLGLPVEVDNVQAGDILEAQALFNIDVCAPLIGAAGQFRRLAGEPHGVILAPQIDFLPTAGSSLGRTCTTNQGGVIIAQHLAKLKFPAANFISFVLSLKKMEPEILADRLYPKLTEVFKYYNLKISKTKFQTAIAYAIAEDQNLKERLALKTAEYLKSAIRQKQNITIICGREYILNPGIYDSHVGKLLKDKGVLALPAYAFLSRLDKNFSYVYWRNPHDLLTKINAITNKKFHTFVEHPKLRELIKTIETGPAGPIISTVQISTFRCGPDTVITPTLAEITKKTPSFLIQSDAMIKELAHLENRVNTYINQLNKRLHEEFSRELFTIGLVEEFGLSAPAGLNKDTDAIYFPTVHDNRTITSVFRAAGLTVIDNYDDETYNLEAKIRLGRKYAGDSVCAPLAGVFADMMLATEDFIKRKKTGDARLKGKTRILVFDNKGTGPCRQGQYYEMHKLLLSKQFGLPAQAKCASCQNSNPILTAQIKLLVGQEKDGFNVGLPEWALIQSFQGVILQGVLHAILLKTGAACRDYDEYQIFYEDYKKLKDKIYKLLETKSKPNQAIISLAKKIGEKSLVAGAIFKYFGYGLYKNNGLRKILKEFTKIWIKKLETKKSALTESKKDKTNKIKIHLEGEAYMRVAQVQEIFKALVDAIGFGAFTATYSPLWCYLELLLEFAILENQEIADLSQRQKEIKEKKKNILRINQAVKILRRVLAGPLYRAAGVTMPDSMKQILNYSRQILPSLKPHGELPPYLGEAILKIKEGTNLFINIAPEGCMVSSMGQLFSDPVLKLSGRAARIQDLFTLNGEVNEEQLRTALLKTLGPEKYYKNNN